MKLKAAIILGIFMILFSGCQKAEKKLAEPKKVHEIKFGILAAKTNMYQGRYVFCHYYHLDLLNDSFFIKDNPALLGGGGEISINGGKYPFRNEKNVKNFIQEAVQLKSGSKVPKRVDIVPLDGPKLYTVIYERDTLKRYFFLKENYPVFHNFIETVFPIIAKQNTKVLSSNRNLKDDSLAIFLNQVPEFKDLLLPPPLSQERKIEFYPSVEKSKEEHYKQEH